MIKKPMQIRQENKNDVEPDKKIFNKHESE